MPNPAPDWPALMTPNTVAAYLDCRDANGHMSRQFAWWRGRDDFPDLDADSGKYYRREIDRFLDSYFGLEDPIVASTRDLDRRYGT